MFALTGDQALSIDLLEKFATVGYEVNQLKVIPTPGGEIFMEFAAGEPAKLLKISGDYCFIQTEKSVRGWVLKEQFASIR